MISKVSEYYGSLSNNRKFKTKVDYGVYWGILIASEILPRDLEHVIGVWWMLDLENSMNGSKKWRWRKHHGWEANSHG